MRSALKYPVERAIPDYLGLTADGKHILWECKSSGKVRRALEQLESGVEWFREHGRTIDLLGIRVERLDGKGPWRRTLGGVLAIRALGDIPIECRGLQVMVEERGDP